MRDEATHSARSSSRATDSELTSESAWALKRMMAASASATSAATSPSSRKERPLRWSGR